MRIEFNQAGTFQAMYAAEAWCREVRGELRHPDDRSLTLIRALAEERIEKACRRLIEEAAAATPPSPIAARILVVTKKEL